MTSEYRSREKIGVTLNETPDSRTPVIAGNPALVAGILISTSRRPPRAHNAWVWLIVASVSCARSGETSSDTRPATPPSSPSARAKIVGLVVVTPLMLRVEIGFARFCEVIRFRERASSQMLTLLVTRAAVGAVTGCSPGWRPSQAQGGSGRFCDGDGRHPELPEQGRAVGRGTEVLDRYRSSAVADDVAPR